MLYGRCAFSAPWVAVFAMRRVELVVILGIIHGECAKITMTHSPQKGKNSNINLFLLFPAPHTGVVPRFAEYLKVGGVSHPINVS